MVLLVAETQHHILALPPAGWVTSASPSTPRSLCFLLGDVLGCDFSRWSLVAFKISDSILNLVDEWFSLLFLACICSPSQRLLLKPPVGHVLSWEVRTQYAGEDTRPSSLAHRKIGVSRVDGPVSNALVTVMTV